MKGLALGLIADDLTGAMDTGAQCARFGLETAILLRPVTRSCAAAEIISTESRELDPRGAAMVARRAAGRLAGRALYKKIDSTLRGQAGPEILAVLQETGIEKAIVCPAICELGRIVQEGELYIDSIRLHESRFVLDPRGGALTSYVPDLLGVPATHLGLALVRSAPDILRQAIRQAPTSVVTLDATAPGDLDLIARASIESGFLPCGALGLARAWVKCLLRERAVEQPAPLLPESRNGVLVIAGSPNPITREQLAVLEQRPRTKRLAITSGCTSRQREAFSRLACESLSVGELVLIAPARVSDTESEGIGMRANLAQLARDICREARPAALLVTGGDTARAVVDVLEADWIEVQGEVYRGVALGKLAGGAASGLSILTKAGGFGGPETLAAALDAAVGRSSV